MKVSIIVPVYGVENYIEKCLKSLIVQDMNDDEYEVIVINDGTKDKSWEIVKRIAQGHKIFRLYEQENKGLSATRNKGFDLATGEYIWCVDSDDYIKKNCLHELYDKAKGKDLLIQTTYIPTGNDVGIKRAQFDAKYNLNSTTGKDLLKTGFLSPAQFYWYKKDWLKVNHLRFNEGFYHEDMEFTPRALFLAETIIFQTDPVYYFYKRPGSITTSFKSKRVYDVIELSKSLRLFYEKHKKEDKSWYILIHACKCIIYGVIMSKHFSKFDRLSFIKDVVIKDSSVCASLWKVRSLKYNIQYLLMKLSPVIYLGLFDKLYEKKYKL